VASIDELVVVVGPLAQRSKDSRYVMLAVRYVSRVVWCCRGRKCERSFLTFFTLFWYIGCVNTEYTYTEVYMYVFTMTTYLLLSV